MSLKQEVEPLTVFCQRAFAWSTDKTFTLSSRRGSPPIDHTRNTLVHSSPAQPSKHLPTNHRVLLRRRMRFTLFDVCVHTQLLRTGAAAESAVVWFTCGRKSFFPSFSRFMCSVCLLVSRLIAARGFTGGYRLSGPACFAALMCFSWLPVRTSRAPPTAWPQQTKQGKRRGGVCLIWSSSS